MAHPPPQPAPPSSAAPAAGGRLKFLGLIALAATALALWAVAVVFPHLAERPFFQWYFWGPAALLVTLLAFAAAWLFYHQQFPTLLQLVGPLLALCVVLLFFAVAEFGVSWWRDGHSLARLPAAARDFDGRFWTSQNGRTIVVQSCVVAVAALGMTLIIIAGGIDLSVGNAIALAAVVVAVCVIAGHEFAQRSGWSTSATTLMMAAILIAVVSAGACGAINGLLVSWLKIVPFIITLGTMTVFLGIAKLLADETTVRPPRTLIPAWVTDLVDPRAHRAWLFLPKGAWLVLLMALVLAAVLRYTVFGRHVFAVGSNEATARLCGIPIGRTKVLVYMLGGFFAGIAGVFQFARLSNGNPTSGIGLELKVIAAVVIGGGSLSGGRGSVLGTLAGAVIMSVIASGCTMLGLSNPIQDIIIGVIIVAAVALDRLRQRGG